MKWEDTLKRESMEDILFFSRKDGDEKALIHRRKMILFGDRVEYDDDELFGIVLFLLEKVAGRAEIDKLKDRAAMAIADIARNKSEDRFLQGMDEKEYAFRYILSVFKNTTLKEVINAVFPDEGIWKV